MEQVIARYVQHVPAIYDATEAYPPVGVNVVA